MCRNRLSGTLVNAGGILSALPGGQTLSFLLMLFQPCFLKCSPAFLEMLEDQLSAPATSRTNSGRWLLLKPISPEIQRRNVSRRIRHKVQFVIKALAEHGEAQAVLLGEELDIRLVFRTVAFELREN